MSQHTPGPWKVDQVEPHVAVVIKRPDLYVTVDHRENLTNAGPDARLIAQAPEMLAMLASCLAYFDDMKNSGTVESSHVTGKDFAPDAQWLAPIRALLREIEEET
mgnify:CR=1 FL=1